VEARDLAVDANEDMDVVVRCVRLAGEDVPLEECLAGHVDLGVPDRTLDASLQFFQLRLRQYALPDFRRDGIVGPLPREIPLQVSMLAQVLGDVRILRGIDPREGRRRVGIVAFLLEDRGVGCMVDQGDGICVGPASPPGPGPVAEDP